MSNSSAKLLVFVSDRLVCVKIVGRANFTSSIDFKTLLNELIQKNFSCFVLDLSECLLMDSTFLGVLAGFGLRMNATHGKPGEMTFELLNPNQRISELLENLGVLQFFTVTTGPGHQANGTTSELIQPERPAPTREEVTRNCLEAHKLLMEIDPANVPKFKEVTQFLADDLKRIKATS